MRDPHHDASGGAPPELPDVDDAALARQLFPVDDAAGPAPRRSPADLDALVAATLDAHFSGPGAPVGGPPGAPESRGDAASNPSLARHGVALLVVLGLVSLAAYRLARAPGPDPTDAAPTVAAYPRPAGDAAAAPAALPAPDPAPTAAPAPAAPLTDGAPAAAPDEAPAEAATPARPLAAADPRDLLREANALRGRAQFAAAERVYLRVVREHPGSSSAYVAKVAAASLRLERLGNPGGAIALYRAALRDDPSGGLSQEIRRGLALATRRAGQREAEQRALRDFLAHHASAPFAGAARARLDELEAAP